MYDINNKKLKTLILYSIILSCAMCFIAAFFTNMSIYLILGISSVIQVYFIQAFIIKSTYKYSHSHSYNHKEYFNIFDLFSSGNTLSNFCKKIAIKTNKNLKHSEPVYSRKFISLIFDVIIFTICGIFFYKFHNTLIMETIYDRLYIGFGLLFFIKCIYMPLKCLLSIYVYPYSFIEKHHSKDGSIIYINNFNYTLIFKDKKLHSTFLPAVTEGRLDIYKLIKNENTTNLMVELCFLGNLKSVVKKWYLNGNEYIFNKDLEKASIMKKREIISNVYKINNF
jgi:hypothetical protein